MIVPSMEQRYYHGPTDLVVAAMRKHNLSGGTSHTVSIDVGLVRQRILMRLDPALATSLTTPGTDGASPIDVDPDARRCGIDSDALRAMR
jgi:hypothetical protein